MYLIDILEHAIANLPLLLQQDIEFQNIVSILKSLVINVPEEDCYLALDKDRYNSSLFLESDYVKYFTTSNIIISLSFESENVFFSFTIYDLKNHGYGVDLIKTKYDNVNSSISTSLTKGKDKTQVKVEAFSYDDKMFYDYHVEIKYDSNYKISGFELEGEKDELFANKFFVPIEYARLMRLNFKRFRNQINDYRLKGLEETNNEVEQQLGYLFCSPFRLGDLEDFIRNDFLNSFLEENAESLYEVDNSEEELDDYSEEDFQDMNFDEEKINFMLNVLAFYIDINSKVIFSDKLINDIIEYLSNEMVSILNTNGIIIAKINGEFIIYHIVVNNNQFIVMSQFITVEELKNKYLKNPFNSDIKGLNEFIDSAPGRQ